MATANKDTKNKSTPVAADNDQSGAVANVESNLPAYLQNQGPARGAENVKTEDMVIPRLELVQSLSPCLDETNASAYIEGAKAGMLFNNVTREVYGSAVDVIPVFFMKEYIIWKDRKKGGGFVGAFSTMASAEAAMNDMEDQNDHRINDTANHFCLLRNPNTGRLEEIVVSMAVTKLKVSRTWNSLIRLAGGDSFARVYTIGTFTDANKAGEQYKNLTIKSKEFPTEEEYKRAEGLYMAVSAGAVQVNRDEDLGGGDPSGSPAGPTEY